MEKCEHVIGSAKSDKELLCDTYKLLGICNFRLGHTEKSVKNYTQVHRIQKELEEQTLNREIEPTSQELEYTMINLFIEESKLIFREADFQRRLLNASKS